MSNAGQGIGVRSLANAIKDAVESHWGGVAAPLPARRYVTFGDPSSVPWDCEQLVISLTGVGFGPAQDSAPPATPRGGTPASIMSIRHAVFSIALVRCIPTPSGRNGTTPPSVAELQEAGERFMTDAGMLSQALVRWATRTTNMLRGDGAASVQLGVIEPGEAAGGFVALTGVAIVTCAGLE